MQQRIRAEMARAESTTILRGIVEADETYVGGKPRKTNDGKSKEPSKRGRGTKNTPVIGAVERGGRVVARVASDLSAKGVLSFVAGVVDPKGTHLITDELPVYTQTHKYYKHSVIKHARRFVEGHVHTNSIESFWALVKRAWYGTHHRYTKKYMPLFLAESCWKYNHRNYERPFEAFMGGVVRGL